MREGLRPDKEPGALHVSSAFAWPRTSNGESASVAVATRGEQV
jgi:hypothetical protein